MIFNSIQRWFRSRTAGRNGFSIICAFNNQEKLDGLLLKSLRKQSVPFEVLLIDNRDETIKSAPRVLNEMAAKAQFDYIMFAHQDIVLDSPFWLSKAQKTLNRLGVFGAAGVAGRNSTGLLASVTHGNPPQIVSSRRLKYPAGVQTLDGCLMIVPKVIFREKGFDEEACTGWHLYVADYCLDLIRRGYKNYVLPQRVYHESMGPSDPCVYETTRVNLLKKHRDHVSTIYTTVGIWETGTHDLS